MSNRDLVLKTIGKNGPQTTAQLAAVTGLKEESQLSLCEMLESKSVLAKDGDSWSLPKAEDPHRAPILAFLSDGPKSVGEIAVGIGVDVAEVRKAMRRAESAGDAQVEGWARGAKWSLALVRRKKDAPKVSKPAKPSKRVKVVAKAKKPAKAAHKAKPNGKANGHAYPSLSGDLAAADDRVVATLDAEIARSFARIEKLKSARDLIASAGT